MILNEILLFLFLLLVALWASYRYVVLTVNIRQKSKTSFIVGSVLYIIEMLVIAFFMQLTVTKIYLLILGV
jgi:hypothetical protein